MKIFIDTSKKIANEPIWICICEGYMYTAATLEYLIVVLNNEWKADKHLVG